MSISSQSVSTPDPSTEQKNNDASHTLFIKKGFVAITTREIAEIVGSNHALFNYYYRRKEKLFDTIMEEQLTNLLSSIGSIINHPQSSHEERVGLLIDMYTDRLLTQTGRIVVVLKEVQSQSQRFSSLVKLTLGLLHRSWAKIFCL